MLMRLALALLIRFGDRHPYGLLVFAGGVRVMAAGGVADVIAWEPAHWSALQIS